MICLTRTVGFEYLGKRFGYKKCQIYPVFVVACLNYGISIEMLIGTPTLYSTEAVNVVYLKSAIR